MADPRPLPASAAASLPESTPAQPTALATAPVALTEAPLPEQALTEEAAPPRRDILNLAAFTFTAAALGGIAWPFLDSLTPGQDVLAEARSEVDLAPVALGQALTVLWRGKPIFIRHRTPAEITEARAVPVGTLRDPATDQARAPMAEWLVVIGICTHLGCVPLGQKPGEPRGDYGGWFCPCHGSEYDTAGRIRRGPAPKNLFLPPYQISGTRLTIG